jgi:hypothetical protein
VHNFGVRVLPEALHGLLLGQSILESHSTTRIIDTGCSKNAFPLFVPNMPAKKKGE